jgi:ankyrin repeat protein
LIVAAGPGLLLAGIQVRNGYLNYLIAQNASGRGYFQGQALKNMGQAVVSRDVAGLQRSAAKANVNAVGDDGMTLLRLAVMEADSAQSDSKSFPPELPVVRTLITLGANPDSGLETATKLRDPEILRVLLEAGADPNLKVSSSPVAFMWINIMPATNLRLLAEHGVDLNAVDQSGTPLVFCAAESENWEAVVFLIEQGAYVGRPDRTGRKLTDLIDDRLSNHTRFGTDPSPGLLRVKALLNPRQHG